MFPITNQAKYSIYFVTNETSLNFHKMNGRKMERPPDEDQQPILQHGPNESKTQVVKVRKILNCKEGVLTLDLSHVSFVI